MARRCPEEFNPWPPFVDIFASVILVLMLFLLITVVNIGYYAQFKSKISYTAEVKEKQDDTVEDSAPPTQKKCEPCKKIVQNKEEDLNKKVSFHKIDKPSFESANNSLFSGGKAEGNAVDYKSDNKKSFDRQKLLLKNRSLEVLFQDKEIFISTQIKYKIKKFVSDINRITNKSVFTIYVSDPDGIVSATVSKQISLGRVLNIKNIVRSSNVKGSRVKINLQEDASGPSEYGSLLIKAGVQ